MLVCPCQNSPVLYYPSPNRYTFKLPAIRIGSAPAEALAPQAAAKAWIDNLRGKSNALSHATPICPLSLACCNPSGCTMVCCPAQTTALLATAVLLSKVRSAKAPATNASLRAGEREACWDGVTGCFLQPFIIWYMMYIYIYMWPILSAGAHLTLIAIFSPMVVWNLFELNWTMR